MSDCGCSSISGPKLKPLEEALELLLNLAKAVEGVETLPLSECLGRVLAEPVNSQVTVPPWDNSAMDGYAINTADMKGDGTRLPVSQRIPAGASGDPLEPGTAARIFTGAPVPPNADAVVIQEVCEADGDDVIIKQPPEAGANIRRAGEDTEKDQQVIAPGTRIEPQHIGLAAAVGVGELAVYRRLKVALFSSGDELVDPGQPLGPGQIYNSNEYTLKGLLDALGCEVVSLGMVEDTFDATCEALSRAAGQADLVMTSGGVSVGEEDYLKPAVEKLGTLDMWKIAIRPGKPLAFGHIEGVPFVGTPGNPVTLFVTFCLFARPFILKMQGMTEGLTPTPLRAAIDFDWPKPDKRREFARARLQLDDQGVPRISSYRSRSSGVLSSLAWSNGLAVLPENQVLNKGDQVEFLPFSELL
ncbi:gephyrin-like molybdotransferase Glp [Solemya velesiana gill symbiont]|uniref:Molybdopterin molybdenumtransferase n=1 Tax=Solemya velesiana gill symbiont TaxID=1918948 RepID=A0A1T2KUX0_9GAMM|nr:gephyrin-like molybdotransferase Glp [Solemya velesiana gill symbiont]OOZ36516.1 molybdopterin molybdenumtransferase MoeA [Solemya velesiana gill symbiont]